MQMIRKLGFVIKVEKLQLEPTTKQKLLGFFIDSVKVKVSSTNDKKYEIINTAGEIAEKSFVKIRKPSQVIRKIVATFPGALYEPLYYKDLEANKISGLKNSKDSYEFFSKTCCST